MKNLLNLLIIFVQISVAQNVKLIKEIDIRADLISSDNLGNFYVIKGSELTKYDKEGKAFGYKFSDKTLGNITSIDASNPLKIALFYRDQSLIIFLDNMLAKTGQEINLQSLGFDQTSLICYSFNNGIWLYLQSQFELIRLKQNTSIEQRTGNLVQIVNQDIKPEFLIEANNFVYMNNGGENIMMFDIFGTFMNYIPVKTNKKFQIDNQSIVYQNGNNIEIYNRKTFQVFSLPIPINENILQIRKEENLIFCLLFNKVLIYSLN